MIESNFRCICGICVKTLSDLSGLSVIVIGVIYTRDSFVHLDTIKNYVLTYSELMIARASKVEM